MIVLTESDESGGRHSHVADHEVGVEEFVEAGLPPLGDSGAELGGDGVLLVHVHALRAQNDLSRGRGTHVMDPLVRRQLRSEAVFLCHVLERHQVHVLRQRHCIMNNC